MLTEDCLDCLNWGGKSGPLWVAPFSGLAHGMCEKERGRWGKKEARWVSACVHYSLFLVVDAMWPAALSTHFPTRTNWNLKLWPKIYSSLFFFPLRELLGKIVFWLFFFFYWRFYLWTFEMLFLSCFPLWKSLIQSSLPCFS